jgi:hypothetical protein
MLKKVFSVRFAWALCMLLGVVGAFAQTDSSRDTPKVALPACKGGSSTVWDQCIGSQTLKSGRYLGQFKLGQRFGRGKLTEPNGDEYDGEWVDGRREGYGTTTYFNGDRYEGLWKADKRDGRGTYRFNNGDTYEGDFSLDARTGSGTYSRSDGKVYRGRFLEGKFHGEGREELPGGTVYEGKWEGGELRAGVMIHVSGLRYEGMFSIVDGRRLFNGRGVLRFPQGDRFEGVFTAGVGKGRGTYLFKNGDVFEGEFESGLMSGQGRLTLKDKRLFVGSVKEGKANGDGILYSESGTKLASGYWENNRLKVSETFDSGRFPFKKSGNDS